MSGLVQLEPFGGELRRSHSLAKAAAGSPPRSRAGSLRARQSMLDASGLPLGRRACPRQREGQAP